MNGPNDVMATTGTVNVNINLNKPNFYIPQQFQIIPDTMTLLNCDGILGNDFLQYNKAILDMNMRRISIGNFYIPMKMEIVKNLKPDLTKIPKTLQSRRFQIAPRSETFILIKIKNPEIKEGVMGKYAINPGVLIPAAILKVQGTGYALTTVLNSSSHELFIDTPEIELDPIPVSANLSNVNVFEKGQNFVNLEERFNVLLSQTDLKQLNREEVESLLPIFKDFSHVFHLPNEPLTCTNSLAHTINTTSDNPINVKNYRYPFKLRNEVSKQVQDMKNQGIITPSNSPWNAPIWIVPKKSGKDGQPKWRLVIDYRQLNDVTVGDSYPLHNITDILDQLGQSKYFTIIDLQSGYHQIPMDPKDAQKTGFSTEEGHFQFSRMPFGLKTAPATFQRLMDNVLAGLLGTRCFVYLDDIVVYARDLDEHTEKLTEVFSRLSEHNLKINPSKCEFLKKEVIYLGHNITTEGCRPNNDKVKSIINFQPDGLRTAKQVKEFMGMVGFYRKFIPNLSEIAQPLFKLLKKNQPFIWTFEQQNAYQNLKRCLSSSPLLKYPNFDLPFVISTDASQYALGAVLSQEYDGNLYPIAYYSRGLNVHEVNYAVIEKEALAIICAMENFRPYVYGTHFKLIIKTDHKPLKWLFNVKDPGSRLLRWRLKLENYNYEIQYVSGKNNSVADALSRDPRFDNVTYKNNLSLDVPSISDINLTKDFDKFEVAFYEETIKPKLILETSKSLFLASGPIVHCVSGDFEMSKGIAKEISSKFPANLKVFSPCLVGNVVSQDVNVKNCNITKIFHLVTKSIYFHKPRYEDVFKALVVLRTALLRSAENVINLPRIASGLDKGDWTFILAMIRYVFADTNLNVIIYHNNEQNNEQNKISKCLMSNAVQQNSGDEPGNESENVDDPLEIFSEPQTQDSLLEYSNQDPLFEPLDQHIFSETPQQISNNTSFEEFSEFAMDNEVANPLYEEISENLETTKFAVAIPLSQDLNTENSNCKLLKDPFIRNLMPTNPTINKIFNLKRENQNFYFIVTKKNYWDTDTYRNLYDNLIRLRKILLENDEPTIAFSKFGQSFNNLKWSLIKQMLKFVFLHTGVKIVIYLNEIKIPMKQEIPGILKEFHSDLSSGHPGYLRMYNRVRQHYKWTNMRDDIRNFVKDCVSCQRNKRFIKKPKAPMELTTTSNKSFEKLFIDIVGPYPITEQGNRFLLTVQDDLTKFSFAIPIPNHEAETVADKLVRDIFTKFGIPEYILTDQGTEFTSKLLKQITTLFKIKHQLSTAYHPQTNGALERSHEVLSTYLRHYIDEDQTNWDKFIEFYIFAYNTSQHRSTGYTPFELLFGYKANIPATFHKEPRLVYGYPDYVSELTHKLKENFSQARANLISNKQKEKIRYDKNSEVIEFNLGDLVYLTNDPARPKRNKKLSSSFSGPFPIISKQSNVNYTLAVGNKEIKVHVNRLKLAKSISSQ